MAKVARDQVAGGGGDGAFEKSIVIVVYGFRNGRGGFHGEGDAPERGQQCVRAAAHGSQLWPRQHIAIFREDVRRNAGGDLAGDRKVCDLSFEPAGFPAGGNQDVGVDRDQAPRVTMAPRARSGS